MAVGEEIEKINELELFNPITYSNRVIKQFLRYQLTRNDFRDDDLAHQLRKIISYDSINKTELLRGPYVSIERQYKLGTAKLELEREGVIHPRLVRRIPHQLYAHQEHAFKEVKLDRSIIISTGTGSGKTESFLYPILDYCFREIDKRGGSFSGVVAVLIYPMNALANDQLDRLSDLLKGTGITFGRYTGETKRESYRDGDGNGLTDNISEHYQTREQIARTPPNILITNIHILEFLLTRSSDLGVFTKIPLKFIVVDEVHRYSGIIGGETAMLLRRLITFNRYSTRPDSSHKVVCLAASATILGTGKNREELRDERHDALGKYFVHKLMGCPQDNITVIHEEYDKDFWEDYDFTLPDKQLENPEERFEELVTGISEATEQSIEKVIKKALSYVGLMPNKQRRKNYRQILFDALKHSSYVINVAQHIQTPIALSKAVDILFEQLEREPSSMTRDEKMYEMLFYLTLGALASEDGKPLLKSKLHYFVRGLQGVGCRFVPDFTASGNGMKFDRKMSFLRNPEATEATPENTSLLFEILICGECGQHYFEHSISRAIIDDDPNRKLSFADARRSEEGYAYFDNANYSKVNTESFNVLMADKFITEDNAIRKSESDPKFLETYLCVNCGTVAAGVLSVCPTAMCPSSNYMKMFVLTDRLERISECLTCGKVRSHRYSSIFHKLNGATVSDVHILSQELVRRLPRSARKLLVFADSRQEAAYQAGWSSDRARVYRLRHLSYEMLRKMEKGKVHRTDPIEFGDLVGKLDEYLTENKDLSRILLTEVYEEDIDSVYAKRFSEAQKRFLHIQVISEATYPYSRTDNLESLGLIKYVYHVSDDDTFIQELAQRFEVSEDRVEATLFLMLDAIRKDKIIYYGYESIFSRKWHESDKIFQDKFLSYQAVRYVPTAIVNSKRDWREKHGFSTGSPEHSRVRSFYNDKGQKSKYQIFMSKCTGLNGDELRDLMEEIWEWFVQTKLVVKVDLRYSETKKIPLGRVYQLNCGKIGIVTNRKESVSLKRYKCPICSRYHSHYPIGGFCSSRSCNGKIEELEEPKENYNWDLFSGEFVMLTPREHTAQVTSEKRAEYEEQFKEPNGSVNALVATPTLELGIDIGSLDVVLHRNIPPTSASYWQRAGRSGRRNKLGVVFNYSDRSSHNVYFFKEPEKILSGRIDPPHLSLQNRVLIRKHVHAIVLSYLLYLHSIQLEEDNNELQFIKKLFPVFITEYLYVDADFVDSKRDFIGARDVWGKSKVEPLIKVIRNYRDNINELVTDFFDENWPEALYLGSLVGDIIDNMAMDLLAQVNRIQHKFLWVNNQIAKYQEKEIRSGLEKDEQRLMWNLRELSKTMKKNTLENYTLSELSKQGFLPAYIGAGEDYHARYQMTDAKRGGNRTFTLNRNGTFALSEFSPGNSLYVDGSIYSNQRFDFSSDKEAETHGREYTAAPHSFTFQNHIVKEGVRESLNFETGEPRSISAIKLRNIILRRTNRIYSGEEYRRRLSVEVLGQLLDEHSGGLEFKINDRTIQFRKDQLTLLLNIGSTEVILTQDKYGYPICSICGANRSNLASKQNLEAFQGGHTESCNKKPEQYGLFTRTHLDGVILFEVEIDKKMLMEEKGSYSHPDTVNVSEALIIGMANVLQIERGDVGFITYGDDPTVQKVFLYDPMKGGSGIITQLQEKWENVIERAIELLRSCESNCANACYSCLKTFRNQRYHHLLDREESVRLLNELRGNLELVSEIPAVYKEQADLASSSEGTNFVERMFSKILKEKGMPQFEQQKTIRLDRNGVSHTIPDFSYEDETKNIRIAIYIDGLSKEIHGNDEQRLKDARIRITLKQMSWEVIEIPAIVITGDPTLLNYHINEISKTLQTIADE